MNVVAATDLLYPGQPDPIGHKGWRGIDGHPNGFQPWPPDPLWYVVWIDAGRWHQPDSGTEMKIRRGLHLVECRNGQGGGS